MLRVLTLASLFPDAARPNFGVFVERQTLELARHRDIAIRVIAPVGVPPWPLDRLARYRDLAGLPHAEVWKGLDVWRPRFTTLPGTGGRFHVAALVRALRPLCRRIRRDFPFDVIDAEFFFPDGPAAVVLGAELGIPVSIKARGADVHHWGRGPTGAQVVRAGRGAAGLLAVSAAMKANMAALGMPGDAIRIHHTGVDLTRFAIGDQAALKARLGVTGPLICSLGALIPRKGHEIVVRAMARLPAATLLIAGEGPSHAAIERLIAELGLGERVRLLGAVAHTALPDLLAASDVMALASSSEGLANAWIEALACGTPICITAAGGAHEVIRDASAGRIVARTPGDFARAIEGLLSAPPPRPAVRAAVSGFTWAANSAALRDHLNRIAGQ